MKTAVSEQFMPQPRFITGNLQNTRQKCAPHKATHQHTFLTSTLDECEWSASLWVTLPPRKKPWSIRDG